MSRPCDELPHAADTAATTPALAGPSFANAREPAPHSQNQTAAQWQAAAFLAFLQPAPASLFIKRASPRGSLMRCASDNLEAQTGTSAAERVGRMTVDLFPPEAAARMDADDWAAVSTGELRTSAQTILGRTYSAVKFPLVVVAETLLAGYSIDITAPRRAEDAQRTVEQELLRAKSREGQSVLATGITLQLNNLLASIQVSVEPAREEASPAVAAHPAEAEGALRAAASVSESVVTYLGRPRSERRPTYVGHRLTELLPHLRAAAPPTVGLTLDVGPDVPVCATHPSELHRPVVPLVTNAWEAAGRGRCTVRLSARRLEAQPPGAPPPTAQSRGAWTCLAVSDDGPGMDAETRARLFVPFFTTKHAGLGLAVVQRVIRAHGGALLSDSAPG